MNLQKARTGMLAAVLAGLGVMGLAGCGGDNPTATPVIPTATTVTATIDATATTSSDTIEQPTATAGQLTGGGDAKDLLTKAGAAMKGLKSYHIKAETVAGDVSTAVEGDREPPDKWRLATEVGGVSAEVIIIGNSMYSPVPGTDQYIELPADSSLTGAADAGDLVNTAQNATVVGDEELNGVDTTHLKYSTSMNDASGVSTTAEVDIWIEKSTGYIHQYKTVSSAAGVSTTSTITFSKFNEPITPPIEKPANIMDPNNMIPTIPVP